MELGIGLRAGEVVLDYRILRPFLVQLNRALKARGKWTEKESGKLAASVRDDVWDILGPSSPSVVGGGPGPDSIPLYRHARDALIEVAAEVDRQHQALLTTAGTASVEVNSLAQLYEEFKNAHDTGTARVTVQQTFQCSSSQMSSSDRCT